MNRVFKIIGSNIFLKTISILAWVVYVLLIILNSFSGFEFQNNDNYKQVFLRFLEYGYYDSVADGTTILYNLFLKGFYLITNNVELSFIFLNSISQFLLVIFGYLILRKKQEKISLQFLIILGLYILYILNIKSFSGASNDTFLGVFVIILIYLMTQKIFQAKNNILTFILIGFFLAVCFSIRMTAILVVPLIIITFIIWYVNTNESIKIKIFKIATMLLTFILFVSVFHYPSLIENSKLSFVDKTPKNIEANWTQRNYLGLKKIESGNEKMHRDAIWHNTKFDEVVEYLEKNGKNSLPKSFSEVLIKDPILVLKMFTYNVVSSLLRVIRFWGILFCFLLFPFFKNRKLRQTILNIEYLPSTLFVIFMLMLSFVCFTFIEFRWFIGYEILIPLAIISQLNGTSFTINKRYSNSLISVSLILVTAFNLRSIINLI